MPEETAQREEALQPHVASRWEKIAAFAFGVVFLIAMLVIAVVIDCPSEFQLLVFRVTLALLAAGIGAILPGFIHLQGPFFRAGGALALFAAVYFTNPPKLVQHDGYAESLRRGYASLADRNHGAAINHFTNAITLAPDKPEPHVGLARTRYAQSKFAAAADSYGRAFELGDRQDGAVAYALSMSFEQLGREDDSSEYLSIAQSLLPRNSPLRLDTYFDLGLQRLRSGLESNDLKELEDAESHFETFLELGGEPQHWVYYHQACSRAAKAGLLSDPAEQQRSRDEALGLLNRAVLGVSTYRSIKGEVQRAMMKDLLRGKGSGMSGEPIVCQTLVDLATTAGVLTSTIEAIDGQ